MAFTLRVQSPAGAAQLRRFSATPPGHVERRFAVHCRRLSVLAPRTRRSELSAAHHPGPGGPSVRIRPAQPGAGSRELPLRQSAVIWLHRAQYATGGIHIGRLARGMVADDAVAPAERLDAY